VLPDAKKSSKKNQNFTYTLKSQKTNTTNTIITTKAKTPKAAVAAAEDTKPPLQHLFFLFCFISLRVQKRLIEVCFRQTGPLQQRQQNRFCR
jgi:hypothetical protein